MKVVVNKIMKEKPIDISMTVTLVLVCPFDNTAFAVSRNVGIP